MDDKKIICSICNDRIKEKTFHYILVLISSTGYINLQYNNSYLERYIKYENANLDILICKNCINKIYYDLRSLDIPNHIPKEQVKKYMIKFILKERD